MAFATNMGRLIGVIAATAGVDRIHGEAILEVLREAMKEAEEKIERKLENEAPDQRMIRLYRGFMAAYTAEAADPTSCDGG